MPAVKGKPVMSRRKRVTLKCVVCGNSYEKFAYMASTSKYCSKQCWAKRGHRKCEGCGVVFGSDGHYGKKYCSKACAAKVMVGEKAASWKDGNSLKRNRGRLSWALAVWRQSVKSRDLFRCVKCGNEEHLHAHHVKNYSEHPELATDVNNGVTLCEICHSNEHGRWIGPKSRSHCWIKLSATTPELTA